LQVVTDIGEQAFNSKFKACPVVQYNRNGAVHSVYKRITPIPDNFNAYKIFTETWRNTPTNTMGTDFEIFSNVNDLLNDQNQWTFCNYNDPDVAYPRDCGRHGWVPNQWFSMPGGRFNAHSITNGAGFTLFNECPIDFAASNANEYTRHEGKHCDGSSIYKWADGSNADYGAMSGIESCKAECDAHAECAGFVQRDSDNKCGFWKKGPLKPYPYGGHHCYEKRAPAADYEDVNTAQWCSDHEDRMNICDGDIDSCWEAGMDLCDSEGDSCFGVMINAGWTQAFRGVKICLSDRMADKGDWNTRMKISSAVVAADYEDVYTAQWCSDHEDRMNICDGDIDSCWKAGMALCDTEGDSCFGVMINAGWTQAFGGVKICLSDVMVDKGDWITRMKISSAVEAFLEDCRWETSHDQTPNSADYMGWTCADNEILTGFGLSADEHDITKVQCCKLGGHSAVKPNTCTYVDSNHERAKCGNGNDHMVFSGAYDKRAATVDAVTEILAGKCCEVECDSAWCAGKDWGVDKNNCQVISTSNTNAQELVCPTGTLMTEVEDGLASNAHGVQKVASVTCCALDLIAPPTMAPSAAPTTDMPTLAPTSVDDCLLGLRDPQLTDSEYLADIDRCLPGCRSVPHRRALESRLLSGNNRRQ